MPILGIWASSFRSAAGPVGAYDALASVTLSSATNTISFAGIPSGYKHLQIRAHAQASTAGLARIRFNGDAGANYFGHDLVGNGSSANAYAYPNINQVYIWPSSDSVSPYWSDAIVDVLDYSATTKNKTARVLCGYDANGSGYIELVSGAWNNTAAINSIEITTNTGNFTTNSQFALYGIK
jgi:hypothetical protein